MLKLLLMIRNDSKTHRIQALLISTVSDLAKTSPKMAHFDFEIVAGSHIKIVSNGPLSIVNWYNEIKLHVRHLFGMQYHFKRTYVLVSTFIFMWLFNQRYIFADTGII